MPAPNTYAATRARTAPSNRRGVPDNWRDASVCLDEDPDLFFPLPSETQLIEAAKTICRGCPVQATCLQDAIDTRDENGIRGGMTGEERVSARRRAQKLARRAAGRTDTGALFPAATAS